jgi:two-component system cell cycle sensor histidine kinase/response regulator CckA
VPGVRGIVVNWRDVTQQQLAELELQRTAEMLKAVADGTTDAVFVKDLQGKYLLFNEAAGRFVGRPPAEVLGHDDTDLFDPQSARRVMDRDRRVMETGQVETEEEVLTAAGVTRAYQATKAPYRDAAGRTIGLIGISRDITASQQARAALLASEERYRSLVDLAPEGIGILQEGRLVYVNQAGARMMQAAKPEDLVGLDLNAALHPDDREISAQRQATVLTTGRAVPLHEVQLRRLDGQYINVETCAGPCTFDGRPAIQIVARDITARKQAEAAFRDSEERYRRLIELLPDAVYINCNNRIVFCNPALPRLLGAKDASQILGKTPYDIFAPSMHELITARNQRMLELGEAAPLIEEELLRLDGRTVAVHVAAAPISFQGQPSILVVLHDLSELRRSEELLRSVLRSVNDAIVTVNELGVIESVNPAAERLFDYAAPELIGQPLSLLMPPPHDAAHPNYVAQFVHTGVPRVIGVGREVEAQRKGGSTFPAELSVTEFRFNDARHFTGVMRDLTERKRLEEQVRQSQKMEAIGQLAGGVAHDFNNLLTVILGFSDLLLNEQHNAASQRDSLLAIRAAGERAAALTKQLLAFGRKALIEPKVIDLNETVAQIDKMLRRLIGEDIVLSLRLDSALPPVKVDPSQIEQVLMNLVVNARDAMPQGGRLTIATQAATVQRESNRSGLLPGSYAQLTVTDTGHGMTAEMQQRIFDPFYTTKEAGKGTGLGLAVVHGIVKQSGGQIEVESQLGVGTSFHVLLPAAVEPLPPPGALAEHPPDERGTESILLVEDEDAVRTIAALALESRGYHVLTAASGQQALRLIDEQRFRPDLILTDVVMSGLSGPQLAAALLTEFPRLKILYLSGYTDDAVVRHGLAGCDAGFLAKPYTARSLAHKVREVLNRALPRVNP